MAHPSVRQQLRRKSEQMLSLCNSASCRRKELLQYFGETYEKESCDLCDNCCDDVAIIDGTIIAQKILSCVYRLKQRFGVSYAIDVLYGAKTKLIKQRYHDQLSTYGILADLPKLEIRHYIFTLINQGYLTVSEGDYPILCLTKNARAVLFEKKAVEFRKKWLKPKETSATRKSTSAKIGRAHV